MQQLISNFNELITTNSNWRAAYAKVEATLGSSCRLNAPPPLRGPQVQSARAARRSAIDPAIRTKLVEFREHLTKFETVAGGAAPCATGAPPAAAAGGNASADSGTSRSGSAYVRGDNIDSVDDNNNATTTAAPPELGRTPRRRPGQ